MLVEGVVRGGLQRNDIRSPLSESVVRRDPGEQPEQGRLPAGRQAGTHHQLPPVHELVVRIIIPL